MHLPMPDTREAPKEEPEVEVPCTASSFWNSPASRSGRLPSCPITCARAKIEVHAHSTADPAKIVEQAGAAGDAGPPLTSPWRP